MYQPGGGGSKPDFGLQNLINSIREFGQNDISHSELGTANGFQEIQKVKEAICDYFIELLSMIAEEPNAIDASVRETIVKRINDEGLSLRKIEEEIERLAKDGVHTQEFPTARSAQLQLIRERGGAVKLELQPYEAVVRAKRLERRLASGDLDRLEKLAEEKSSELDRLVGEAGKILNNLQSRVMTKGVDDAASTFGVLSATHARQERNWFLAFLAAGATTLAGVAYVLIPIEPAADALHLTSALLRRLLVLSVPAVFTRVTLAKYNLERNLRIIYAHREAVLAQYRVFESGIGNDAAAKNQFRIEIAKYIFSDPVTGYVTSDVSSEININPMVSLLDKASGR